MPGANWVNRDYEAIAVLTANMSRAGDGTHVDWIIREACSVCWKNAKYDVNGNRNFNEERFINRVHEIRGDV